MDKKIKFNYEEDVNIDRDSLDEELIKQPGLYFKYAKAAEDLQDEVKSLQREMAVLDAELEDKIRKEAKKKEGEKAPTNQAVAAQIQLDSDHQEIEKEIAEKEHELRVLRNAGVGALEHKKSSLKHLTELYVSGYWSDVKSANAADLKKKGRQKIDDEITDNLNKPKTKRRK